MSLPTVFRDLDRSNNTQSSELVLIVNLFDALHRLMSCRCFGGEGSDCPLTTEQYQEALASKAIIVIQKLVSSSINLFLSYSLSF